MEINKELLDGLLAEAKENPRLIKKEPSGCGRISFSGNSSNALKAHSASMRSTTLCRAYG